MAIAEVSLKEFQTTSLATLELDKVCVEGLALNANTGFDGFGRPKPQPISVDATIFLGQTITSAASVDALDQSTLHYGELSKALVKRMESLQSTWHPPQSFLNHLNSVIISFAYDRSAIARVDLVVRFKSASVTCLSGSSLCWYNNYLANSSCLTFTLDNMVLPALIGVNDHERQMRQQISIGVTMDRLSETIVNECYQAEQIVVKVGLAFEFGAPALMHFVRRQSRRRRSKH